MIKKQSAGILLYRKNKDELEVFLVHPGGPFWAKKEIGAWSVPKGEFEDEEDALTAAKRELEEETGISVSGDFIELQPIKLKSGKTVFAWAIEKDAEAAGIVSNHFEMEWPPHSGKMQPFPEIDRAAWFTIEEGRKKINAMQVGLLTQLQKIVNENS